MEFKNGERVWVYETGHRPVEGNIIGKMDGLGAYYVRTDERRPEKRARIEQYIYPKNKRGFEDMIDALQNDAADLKRYAMEIAELYTGEQELAMRALKQ